MKSLDTNVLARFLVRDDPAQTARADALMRGEVMVAGSVLVETAWLLASRYRKSRAEVADGLAIVLSIANLTAPAKEGYRWAVERMRAGADFADMIHLVESREANRFATFDQALASAAGAESPIPVETLRA